MYSQLILLVVCGLPLATSDIRSRRIPNRTLLIMFATSELCRLIFDPRHFFHVQEVGLAALGLSCVLYLLSGRKIGMGDLKLIVVLGVVIGDFQRGFFAWFIALFAALVTALISRSKSIPFAPALIVGALLAL